MFGGLYEKGRKIFERVLKNKHLQYGVPLICFVSVCLAVVSQTATIRYEFRKTSTLDKAELKKLGIKIREVESLEDMYEKIKEMDIDNWENIRGPRLWDETPPTSD